MNKRKRRIFEIKQRKKRKEKLRKRDGATNSPVAAVVAKKFKRADKFVGSEEALEAYFIPADGVMYRLVHDPVNENDYRVQNEQEFDGIANTRSDLPFTVAPGSTKEEQFEHLKEWMLSYYLDDERLAKDMLRYHDKRKTDAAKEKFKAKMGFSVAKYNMLPEVGVMQREPDPNTQLVVAEYEDINLEDYRDKEFGLKPLTDYRDGKKK